MKAVVKTVDEPEREQRFEHIRPLYLEALTLVERLHRRLLDVIKDEFDRRGRSDINSVQALLLYNIGDKELTAGELRTRGYYLGSNVSYNLKKLVEMVEEAHFDELLQIVGDVGAEIVAAAAQLAGGQLFVADIVEQ